MYDSDEESPFPPVKRSDFEVTSGGSPFPSTNNDNKKSMAFEERKQRFDLCQYMFDQEMVTGNHWLQNRGELERGIEIDFMFESRTKGSSRRGEYVRARLRFKVLKDRY